MPVIVKSLVRKRQGLRRICIKFLFRGGAIKKLPLNYGGVTKMAANGPRGLGQEAPEACAAWRTGSAATTKVPLPCLDLLMKAQSLVVQAAKCTTLHGHGKDEHSLIQEA